MIRYKILYRSIFQKWYGTKYLSGSVRVSYTVKIFVLDQSDRYGTTKLSGSVLSKWYGTKIFPGQFCLTDTVQEIIWISFSLMIRYKYFSGSHLPYWYGTKQYLDKFSPIDTVQILIWINFINYILYWIRWHGPLLGKLCKNKY